MEVVVAIFILVIVVMVVLGALAGPAALSRTETLRKQVDELGRQVHRLRAEVRELLPGRRGTESPAAQAGPPPVAEAVAGNESVAGTSTGPAPGPQAEAAGAAAPGTAAPPPEARPGEPAEELSWEDVVEGWVASGTPARPAARVAERTPSIEERIGARAPVWIGAVAVTLAGVFLVKWTFDENLLTPPVRVILGSILGVALLVAGERLHGSAWRVAQGLSASGTAILYACIVAAVNAYDLVSPELGFGLAALTTAVAVLLSLRQGIMVAAIGLVGGYLMPWLIQPEVTRPGVLFGYIFLLETGLVAIASGRGWWGLCGLALLGGGIWSAVWVGAIDRHAFPASDGGPVGLFLLGTAGLFLASAMLSPRAGKPARPPSARDEPEPSVVLAWTATASALVLLAFLARASGYGVRDWAFLGILSASCLAAGRLDSSQVGLPALSALTGAALLLAWDAAGIPASHATRFGLTALGLGALHAAGAWGCLFGARHPTFWAGLAGASATAYLLVAKEGGAPLPFGLPWWGATLALGIVLALAAVPVLRRQLAGRLGSHPASALILSSALCCAIAAFLKLEREWISISWALGALALAWLDRTLDVRAVRVGAWLLAAAACSRLLLNPAVLDYPIGTSWPWNWTLWGYGVPALALARAAGVVAGTDRDRGGLRESPVATELRSASLLLVVALIALQVRQAFHPGDLAAERWPPSELGVLSCAWLAWGILLLRLWRQSPRPALLHGGALIGGAAIALAVVASLGCANPIATGEPIGAAPIVNALLLTLGAPALLSAIFASQLSRYHWKSAAASAAIASLVLLSALVTFQVRQAFQGSILRGPYPTSGEWYAYSAAWAALGMSLLAAGIATRGAILRYASLVAMLATVVKVFLFDMSELRDLYRVVSFLGLGLSLFLLAWLYQRFVFRR